MSGILWQPPKFVDGSWYITANFVTREEYERLKNHSVFGRIVPLLSAHTAVLTGCFPNAVTLADARQCRNFLEADFPPYGVVELNDYLESVIVDALLAGLVDKSDDWMQWGLDTFDDTDDGWRGSDADGWAA